MKQKIVLLFFFTAINLTLFSQEKISLDPPQNWVQFQRSEILNSIYHKYSFSDKVLKELEESGKGSIQLLSYYTNQKEGLYTPNIQVILRPNNNKGIADLKLDLEKSLEGFSKVIKGFVILEKPSVTIINDKEAISMKFKGYNTKNDEVDIYFETILIAIPSGNIFYQITLNQSIDDHFDQEFADVINSVKLD